MFDLIGRFIEFVGAIVGFFTRSLFIEPGEFIAIIAASPGSSIFEILFVAFLLLVAVMLVSGLARTVVRRSPFPFIHSVEYLSRLFGLIGGWIIVALIVSMVYEVISRYFLNAPTQWAFEMAYMLMGASFMFGIAWCLQMRRHIRVDFVYDHVSPRYKAIIDLVGFFLLLPMLLWLCAGLWDYFHQAYRVDEQSGESAWNPIIWPFKYTFVMGFVLLLMQSGGGDRQVRHGALRPRGPRAQAGGGPVVSVELALRPLPARRRPISQSTADARELHAGGFNGTAGQPGFICPLETMS